MDILYNKIQAIKQRPGLYLGRKSLLLLRAYLNGYVDYHNETVDEPNYFFLPQFQEYIQKRYNMYTTHGWADIITFYEINEDDAFDRFYALLDDFFNESSQ